MDDMDKEVLDMFHARINEIMQTLEGARDQVSLDEYLESPATGKLIVPKFDDVSLEDLQLELDTALQQLQDFINIVGEHI